MLPVFSWIWIVAMARDMYGPMTGASAWMMTLQWDAPHLLLLWAMWTVMMTGMMLPSASPLILLYGAAARRSAQRAASASDLRARRRVPPRLDRVQSWRDRASASTRVAAARLADDGGGESPRQCDPAARRRGVSVDAAEARMSASVPVAHWFPDGPMAQVDRLVRFVWVSSTGPIVWAVAGR